MVQAKEKGGRARAFGRRHVWRWQILTLYKPKVSLGGAARLCYLREGAGAPARCDGAAQSQGGAVAAAADCCFFIEKKIEAC